MKPHLSIHVRDAARTAAAFTLIELLAVISIMAILAGLLVGLAPQASARMKESRTRAELEQLVTAIETYKAKYGVYPPDNVTGRDAQGYPIVDPAKNPLYLELNGLIVQRVGSGGYFVPVGSEDTAFTRLDPLAVVQAHFNRDGFINAALTNNVRRLYHHEFKASQHAPIAGNPIVEVLVAPVPWPLNDPTNPPPIPFAPGLNPWRYVSSNPTNNPAGFDLWAEIFVRGKKRIIGNWKN